MPTTIEIIEALRAAGHHEAADMVRGMARRRSKHRNKYPKEG